MLSGILAPREALSGFGDPVVPLVAGLLVVGEMLNRTGVAYGLGNWISRVGGASETRLLILLMVSAAVLSGVMSSTAVAAVFIPVVLTISARTDLNASHLLMPLSFAALVGGMLTLIATTPNLVVNAELEGKGMEAFVWARCRRSTRRSSLSTTSKTPATSAPTGRSALRFSSCFRVKSGRFLRRVPITQGTRPYRFSCRKARRRS
jgi:hypothetical protein